MYSWFKKLEHTVKKDLSVKNVESDLKKAAIGALQVASVVTTAALTYGFTAAGAAAGTLIDPAGGEVLGGLAGNFVGGLVGGELTKEENKGITALGGKVPPAIIGEALTAVTSFGAGGAVGDAKAVEGVGSDVEAAETVSKEAASVGDTLGAGASDADKLDEAAAASKNVGVDPTADPPAPADAAPAEAAPVSSDPLMDEMKSNPLFKSQAAANNADAAADDADDVADEAPEVTAAANDDEPVNPYLSAVSKYNNAKPYVYGAQKYGVAADQSMPDLGEDIDDPVISSTRGPDGYPQSSGNKFNDFLSGRSPDPGMADSLSKLGSGVDDVTEVAETAPFVETDETGYTPVEGDGYEYYDDPPADDTVSGVKRPADGAPDDEPPAKAVDSGGSGAPDETDDPLDSKTDEEPTGDSTGVKVAKAGEDVAAALITAGGGSKPGPTPPPPTPPVITGFNVGAPKDYFHYSRPTV